MGYYTQYTLEVRKIKNEAQFNELVDELRSRELIGYAFDDGHYPATISSINHKYNDAIFYSYDECKWYDHAEDMVVISEKFPNMYFELSGEGEAFGDYWKEYYHDGDIEECRGEIVYEQPKKVQWQELVMF